MRHPEQKPNEFFIGNQRKGESKDYMSELKSLRLGTVAYDINGTTEDMENYVPIFLDAEDYDVYNDIMERRMQDTRRGVKS